NARRYSAEIQLYRIGKLRLGHVVGAEHSLRLAIRFGEIGALLASGEAEVANRFVVNGEEAHGCAVLRSHVSKCRAIGERQRREPVAVELDELADDFLLAKHLGDSEHQV